MTKGLSTLASSRSASPMAPPKRPSQAAQTVSARYLRVIGSILSAYPPVLVKTEDERVDAAWLLQLIALHLEGPPIRERVKLRLPLQESSDDLL